MKQNNTKPSKITTSEMIQNTNKRSKKNYAKLTYFICYILGISKKMRNWKDARGREERAPERKVKRKKQKENPIITDSKLPAARRLLAQAVT